MRTMLLISAILALFAGSAMLCGGIWGIVFTYQNVAQEKIVTTPDSSIPDSPVRGPLTLKAQVDVIRKHVLETTSGQVYAEMPRQVPKLDTVGKPVLGSEGTPVMVPNTARDIWITATALTTALNLGIITYVFSGLVLFLGMISIWTSLTFFVLRKKY